MRDLSAHSSVRGPHTTNVDGNSPAISGSKALMSTLVMSDPQCEELFTPQVVETVIQASEVRTELYGSASVNLNHL